MSEYHHGNLKKALLSAGIGIISEKGISALSLRNAAARAGVSHSAPYRHFKNMEDFLADIASYGFELLVKKLSDINIKYAADPVKCFKKLSLGYFEFAAENRDHYRLMFGEGIKNKTENEYLFRAYDSAYQVIKNVVLKMNSSLTGIKGEPDVTAISIWSALHGYSSLIIDNSKDKWVGSKSQKAALIEKLILMVG